MSRPPARRPVKVGDARSDAARTYSLATNIMARGGDEVHVARWTVLRSAEPLAYEVIDYIVSVRPTVRTEVGGRLSALR